MSEIRQRRKLRGFLFHDAGIKDTNFFDADICDVDFTDANLTGAIFTKAKIKGTNFTGTNLTGAIFDEAVFGVKTSWILCILIIFLFIISLSAFSASIVISCIYFYFYPRIRGIFKIISTIFISVVYITFVHAYWLKNLLINLFKIDQSGLTYIGICIIFVVGVFVPFIKVMDEYKSEKKQIFFTIIVFSISLILLNLYLLEKMPTPNDDITRRAISAFFGSSLGAIISNQAIIEKDKNYVWIWDLFVHIVSANGTKFYLSNLDDASFVNANITGTSFVKCTAIRTNWESIKRIDCSRFQVNYLQNPKIRYLLTQKQFGKDKDWQGMNLQGLNLSGANLNNINFSRVDLRYSTLNGAKLQKSNFSQTQLDNVDLSGVDITDAIIGIKSIPSTAKVDGLICKYFRPESNPERRYPINGELTSKEAIKLLQKSLEIMLPFKQGGIDWQAFLQSFENCLKEFDISLDDSETLIQAFERESDGDFVIKLNVPDNVEKNVFKQKLQQEYERVADKLKRENLNVYKMNNIDFKEDTKFLVITTKLAKCRDLVLNITNTGNNTMSASYQSKYDQKTLIISL